MLHKLKIVLVLVAATCGLLALAAPAQAAPVTRKLTAAEAASQFKVVPLKGVKRQSGPTARATICEPYTPSWAVIYLPTNTQLFTQSTDLYACTSSGLVNRLFADAEVTVAQPVNQVNFVRLSVVDSSNEVPGEAYGAAGFNTFTYCPPGQQFCVGATHVVEALIFGTGEKFTSGYFV
jgi:hypothetical protein